MLELEISLPLQITYPGKKKRNGKPKPSFNLNLNVYRNTHYHTSNKVKIEYGELLDPKLDGLPCLLDLTGLYAEYTFYYSNRARRDNTNIGSIVSKFTEDWLVTNRVIKDDDSKVITATSFIYGGVSKRNPRAELRIYSGALEHLREIRHK